MAAERGPPVCSLIPLNYCRIIILRCGRRCHFIRSAASVPSRATPSNSPGASTGSRRLRGVAMTDGSHPGTDDVLLPPGLAVRLMGAILGRLNKTPPLKSPCDASTCPASRPGTIRTRVFCTSICLSVAGSRCRRRSSPIRIWLSGVQRAHRGAQSGRRSSLRSSPAISTAQRSTCLRAGARQHRRPPPGAGHRELHEGGYRRRVPVGLSESRPR